MKCTNCGKTTDEYSRFCNYCGEKLNLEQRLYQDLDESKELDSVNTVSTLKLKAAKHGKKRAKKHGFFLSVLILVMLSFFVVLWQTGTIKIHKRKSYSYVLKEVEDSNTWIKYYEDIQGLPNSIIPTKNGGYVLAGSKGGTWIMKIDNNGNIDWEKTFGKNSV